MSHTPDWLPQNHEALISQANQTYDYIKEDPQRSRMGFDPATPQGIWFNEVFIPSFAAFGNAISEWRDPATRTRAHTAAMMTARKKFVPLYRKLYTGWLKSNPLVTDEDLVYMGLPRRSSGSRKPSALPLSWPVGFADTSTLRHITIAFGDSSAPHKKARPSGVHGAEIRWTVFDAPQVARLEDLVYSSFDTHTPFRLDFKEEERGKVFCFTMRWENTRGGKGPFGPIQEVFIP
jgi:hypothetical protein